MKKQIEYKEYLEDPNAPIRLNKFLANAGVCSRREADQFIQAGVVSVNGQVVTELGTKVQRTDEIHFHDQLVSIEKKVYVILNKPKDYVTTSDDPQQRKTVMDLVKNCCRERIYPVGRLDRNTTGVLLFTNDGDLASKLTHPKFLKKKIYHVHLDKNLTAADMKQIAEGIMLEDGEIKADAISYASETDRKQVGSISLLSGYQGIARGCRTVPVLCRVNYYLHGMDTDGFYLFSDMGYNFCRPNSKGNQLQIGSGYSFYIAPRTSVAIVLGSRVVFDRPDIWDPIEEAYIPQKDIKRNNAWYCALNLGIALKF